MDDLISRQAAIDAVIKRDANCGIDSAEVLKDLPTADVEEVRHGKWLEKEWTLNYVCSACHLQGSTNKTDRCPNCGALMVDEVGE